MKVIIKIIVAGVFTIFGVTILLSIPSDYEGPLLVALAEGHDFNLTDAAGIIVTIFPWGYLLFDWIRERAIERKQKTQENIDH